MKVYYTDPWTQQERSFNVNKKDEYLFFPNLKYLSISPKDKDAMPSHMLPDNEPYGLAVLITVQNRKSLRMLHEDIPIKKAFTKRDHYFVWPYSSKEPCGVLPWVEFYRTYKFVGFPTTRALVAIEKLH